MLRKLVNARKTSGVHSKYPKVIESRYELVTSLLVCGKCKRTLNWKRSEKFHSRHNNNYQRQEMQHHSPTYLMGMGYWAFSIRAFSKERLVRVGKNVVQSWDLKIENPAKTGHKIAGRSNRKETQFRLMWFIDSKIILPVVSFFIYICLLRLETPLTAEMRTPTIWKKRDHNGVCSLRKAQGSD